TPWSRGRLGPLLGGRLAGPRFRGRLVVRGFRRRRFPARSRFFRRRRFFGGRAFLGRSRFLRSRLIGVRGRFGRLARRRLGGRSFGGFARAHGFARGFPRVARRRLLRRLAGHVFLVLGAHLTL